MDTKNNKDTIEKTNAPSKLNLKIIKIKFAGCTMNINSGN